MSDEIALKFLLIKCLIRLLKLQGLGVSLVYICGKATFLMSDKHVCSVCFPLQIIFHKQNPGIDYEFYVPVENKDGEKERLPESETPRESPRERPREREPVRAPLHGKKQAFVHICSTLQ